MHRINGVTDNLRFMVNEVITQVEQALQFFAEPSRTMMEKINARDDYIDSLKSVIQEKTFTLLISSDSLDRNRVNLLRSVNTIALNLERIGDFCVNMLRQSGHLTRISFINDFEPESFFEEILTGLERIEPALDKRDIGQAYRICQCEFRLDELYEAKFKVVLSGLKSGHNAGDLITTLLILHYLERMGDSLLNIGEAILFALIGERMKIQQYTALTEGLSASGLETSINDVEFESIWGTRSGCRIGLVGEKAKEDATRPVIFKHGKLKKLAKEKDNIKRWEKLIPGLPPEVCSFLPGDEEDGSIILEYLPGCTFQEIVLSQAEPLMKDALFMIEETIGQVWRTTMRTEPVGAGFIRQVRDRMDVVYRLHPEFMNAPSGIGHFKIRSFGELLREAEQVERELAAPFSVFIHGDFNVNNIIHNSNDERIHFIDLHRSAQTDYVQDVSVFLISLYRLPVFDRAIRTRLNYAIMDFFEFAKNFALAYDDRTFEARLALGLARSFFTSTRFELNRRFSKKMYLLSIYLLEKTVDWKGKPWEEFEIPGETLIY